MRKRDIIIATVTARARKMLLNRGKQVIASAEYYHDIDVKNENGFRERQSRMICMY